MMTIFKTCRTSFSRSFGRRHGAGGGRRRAVPRSEPAARAESGRSCLPVDSGREIGMLAQVQPAIPRLGIKAFTNFTEGLHGLGRVRGGSVTATTFPQSVGLGRRGIPRFCARLGRSKAMKPASTSRSTMARAWASPYARPTWTWPGTRAGAAPRSRSAKTRIWSGKCRLG